MDKRVNNGGRRKGAGRKSKAEEQKLIERLKPYELTVLKKLYQNIDKGERWAIELYFKYMYGMPKQQTDITTNGESMNIPVINFTTSE